MAALFGIALRQPGWLGEGLLRHSYDSLHALSGTRSDVAASSPIVIAYLDLHSFRAKEKNPAQPWPREVHAQLLQQLKRMGARAVVSDIIFSDAGPDAAAVDQELNRH